MQSPAKRAVAVHMHVLCNMYVASANASIPCFALGYELVKCRTLQTTAPTTQLQKSGGSPDKRLASKMDPMFLGFAILICTCVWFGVMYVYVYVHVSGDADLNSHLGARAPRSSKEIDTSE